MSDIVYTLVPPVDVVGRRPRADERDWRVLVFEPGKSLVTVEMPSLPGGAGAEEAQARAAQTLGLVLDWQPVGRAWRGRIVADQKTEGVTL